MDKNGENAELARTLSLTLAVNSVEKQSRNNLQPALFLVKNFIYSVVL
jgi:hypothetical protein